MASLRSVVPLPDASLSAADIVVVGGGMAAVMAALAAKTPANRVLIIEPSNVLGGQGTAGGVAGFCGDTARVNRPFAELVGKLSRHDLIEPYRPNDDRRAFDLEWCAFFLQEMIVERGVDVLLHSRVVGARAKGGRVTELTVSTSGGLHTLTPRFVIDGSGACVVPVLTGFPVVHEGSNRQLPMSLYFTMWDTGQPVTPILPEGCPAWDSEAEIPMTSLHRFPTGKVEVKMKVVGFDAADGLSRSSAELFARRQMHGLIYFLQTVGYRGKKLDTSVLASVSRGIGVREERRIIGEHVLTEEEVRRAVIFDDAVAVNTYHIDFHWPDKMERAGTGITDMLDPHHLPLRMMIPKGARNLLVPGRGASADQTAMSAFRVMAVVAQMGFAAGHAARMCVENDADLASLDVAQLQAAIRDGGQSLDLSDYGDYLRTDIFTQEWIDMPAEAGPVQGTPALVSLSNGRFLIAWIGSGRIWLAERREKRWSSPRAVSQAVYSDCVEIRLQRRADGAVAIRGRNAMGSWWVRDLAESGQVGKAIDAPGETITARTILTDGTWLSLAPGNYSERREVRIRQESDQGECCTLGSPVAIGSGEASAAFAVLDDGTVALAFRGPDDGGKESLSVALSADRGVTWFVRRSIESDGGGKGSRPTVVATRTGLAVLAVEGDRLVFWHGSKERIISGPPKVSAHELQA